jgi:hypothetical protein
MRLAADVEIEDLEPEIMGMIEELEGMEDDPPELGKDLMVDDGDGLSVSVSSN